MEDMTTGDFSMRKRGQVVEMHYRNCSESGFKLWVECVERTTPPGTSYLKLTIDHKSVPSAPIGGLIGVCVCVWVWVWVCACIHACVHVAQYSVRLVFSVSTVAC